MSSQHPLDFLDKPHPLEFLEKKSDPLEFLEKKDVLPSGEFSDQELDQSFRRWYKPQTRPQEQPNPRDVYSPEATQKRTQVAMDPNASIFDRMGASAAMMTQMGGSSGAPAISDPHEAKLYATELATIAAVEGLMAPIIGTAAASTYAPRLLTALTELTGIGYTGGAVAVTKELADTGELIGFDEAVMNGLEWMVLHGLMRGGGLLARGAKNVYDFPKAINNIAKERGTSKMSVLNDLWGASKNYIKQKFGRDIKGPQDIRPEDVDIVVKEAQKQEQKLLEPITIEVKPIEPKPEPKRVAPKKPKPVDITDPEVIKKNIAKFDSELDKLRKEKHPSATTHEKIKALETAKDTAQDMLKEIDETGKVAYADDKVSQPKIKQNLEQIDNKIDKVKQQDISTKGLREQKQYFLNELENALVKPPDSKTIKIEIPGDGVFNVVNSPDAIKAAIKRVEKKWPEKVPPVAKPPSHKVKQPKKEVDKPLASKPDTARVPLIPAAQPKKPNIRGKAQAVARSKIIDGLRKAFNDPIRLGKFKQRALGIHKGWAKVTRLLNDNDVETAAHEIGHNLHYTLYGGNATTPKAMTANVVKELTPYLDELKPISRYSPHTLEGFAEFTRMYVTNPDVARQLAPRFYNKFEADLDKMSPDFKNALLDARDYYAKYLEGTPESRIRAQTSYPEDTSLVEKAVEWADNTSKFDRFLTDWVDDMFPAKRMTAELFGVKVSEVENIKDARNLYRSLRVLKGAVGKADVFAMYETFDPLTLKKTGEGYRAILKQLKKKKDYREFNDYLIARRAVELHGRGKKTGITPEDAIEVSQKYEKKWEALAKQFDNFNDEVLLYAVKSGLISSDAYKLIKQNNMMYAPFSRDMKKDRIGMGTGSSLQAKSPIKRLKGSTRNILPPVESAFRNMYAIILNSEKNLAGKVLGEMSNMKNAGQFVERVPIPTTLKAKLTQPELEKATIKHLIETGQDQFLEFDENGKASLIPGLSDLLPDLVLKFGPTTYGKTENIITVYNDGKPTYYEVSPAIYEMWTKGLEPYSAHILMKIARIPSRTLRAGAILNPKFLQKNFIRDWQGSVLLTKYGPGNDIVRQAFDILYSPLAMMAESAKRGPLYVEWLKAGGGMSTMQSIDRPSLIKHMKEVQNGLKPHQILKILRFCGEVSEEANRLNEFGKALNVEGQSRLGKEISAFAARDLSIDFAKMGLKMKAVNQLAAFSNVTVQGGEKVIRTVQNKEDRANFAARAILSIVLPALWIAWLNKDDERVEEFSNQERDFNFITFNGDLALKIPVPHEVGVLLNGLTQRMYTYFMKEDPDAFKGFMGSIISAALPNLIPNISLPPIEVEANRNFFTDAPIIPKDKVDLAAKYQYKRGTSVSSRLLGRAVAYMIGDPETRNKAASPAIIDHYINSWSGGLGRIVVALADEGLVRAGLADRIPGPDRTIVEKLGFDAFTVRYPKAGSKSIDDFYTSYFDAKSRDRTVKKGAKEGLESEPETEAAYKRVESLYNMQSMDAAYKAIRNSQKAINAIWDDPALDKDLKQTLVDELYLQQIQFAKAANQNIKQYRAQLK